MVGTVADPLPSSGGTGGARPVGPHVGVGHRRTNAAQRMPAIREPPPRQPEGAAGQMRDAHPWKDQETGIPDRRSEVRRPRPGLRPVRSSPAFRCRFTAWNESPPTRPAAELRIQWWRPAPGCLGPPRGWCDAIIARKRRRSPAATGSMSTPPMSQSVPENDVSGLDQDFRWLGLSNHRIAFNKTVEIGANWKLLIEGGLEAYRFRVAYRDTITPFFTDNLSSYRMFGPHPRSVLPRISMPDLREEPRRTGRSARTRTCSTPSFQPCSFRFSRIMSCGFRSSPVPRI